MKCFELSNLRDIETRSQTFHFGGFASLEWFDVEFHSIVIDLAKGELAVVADDS